MTSEVVDCHYGFMDNKPAQEETFLVYFRRYFGDRIASWVDYFVPDEGDRVHIGLEHKYKDPEKAAEAFNSYSHPCWCHPELIYADDERCNEVWLHKRVQ